MLERAIPAAVGAIALGGRVVVMSYHSLEDKIVKGFFQAGSKSSAPLGFPVELEEHKAGTENPDEGHRGAHRRRNRRKPARSLRQAPRRGTHQSQERRMSTAAVNRLPRVHGSHGHVPCRGSTRARGPREVRTPLSVVRSAPRKRRAPFVVLCFGLLAVALMAVLVLNISVSSAPVPAGAAPRASRSP